MIDMYKDHPSLYIKDHEDYYNKPKRDEQLRAMATALGHGITPYDLNKAIKLLRTKLSECLNKIRESERSGAGAVDPFRSSPALRKWWELIFWLRDSYGAMKKGQTMGVLARGKGGLHHLPQ